MSINISMIVKNEEKLLPRCLASIEGLGKAVILDTGSTDGTKAVAEKYMASFIEGQYAWNDNFAEARNKALEYCLSPWVFIIDADEYLTEGSVDAIKKAVETASDNIIVMDMDCEASNGKMIHRMPRLFRRGQASWKGAAHNYLTKTSDVHIDGAKLIYGYSENHQKDPDRTLRILRGLIPKGELGTREMFYLARELSYKGRWEGAYYWCKKYLAHRTWTPERCEALLLMGKACMELCEWTEATGYFSEVIALNPQFKEAYKFLAKLSKDERVAQHWKDAEKRASNKDVMFVRK